MIQILSRQNVQFRAWKSTQGARGIRKENLFIISGKMALEELEKSNHLEILGEIISPSVPARLNHPRTYELAKELFLELDELGTHLSLFIVKVPEFPIWSPKQKPEGLEIFSPLGDPQNLGALLRSAEAFGASKVVLLSECAHPYLPKTLKASAGSALRIPMMIGPALADLSGDFFAMDLKGTSLAKVKWPKNCRLLLGEEGQGLKALDTNKKISLKKISIETQTVESLNVAVAASLALYSYSQNQN